MDEVGNFARKRFLQRIPKRRNGAFRERNLRPSLQTVMVGFLPHNLNVLPAHLSGIISHIIHPESSPRKISSQVQNSLCRVLCFPLFFLKLTSLTVEISEIVC